MPPHGNKASGDWTDSFGILGRVRKTWELLALDWTGSFGISGRDLKRPFAPSPPVLSPRIAHRPGPLAAPPDPAYAL